MPTIPTANRFWVTVSFVTTLFLLVVYQLIQLTVIRQPTLQAVADRQHQLRVEMPPVRGQILDRHGKELATSLKVPSIYAVPRLMGKDRKGLLAKQVSEILGLEFDYVFERFSRDKAFVWVKRRVSPELAEKIAKLKDPSLGILQEYRRFYPQEELMSQVIGFSDIDGRGLEGIELTLNKHLSGRPGLRSTKRDALGREIKAFEMNAIPAIDGNKVYLTFDQYIQYLTEKSLDKAYRQWNAKAAWAIVMDVHTGEVLAMVNRPNFNPNQRNSFSIESRRNRVVTDMYEPGSVFKIVAASAALNEEKITPTTLIDCENGEYRYGSKILHDVHPYGELTFEEVIIKSSNIGTVKIAAELRPEVFFNYIERFGFNKPTGIDMPGEARGFIRHPKKWSKTSPYNIPMGHEVMVTLVQMARAMAVIANGGKLVTPYVLDRVEDQAGVVLKKNYPKVETGIIREDVAASMRSILTRVVEEGTGKRARIDGIPVGGKTGTAQKVLPNGGGYSHTDFMSSFIGFAPADNPKYVMAVVLDDPGPRYYGGTVAAPVFKEVMEATILAKGYVPSDSEVFDPAGKLGKLQETQPTWLANSPQGKAL